MYRTPQYVYASNLLREQNFGYPLRNPEPTLESDMQGVRIGDVGYVSNNGEFNRVLNIGALPTELQSRFEAFSFEPPSNKREFKSERVFSAGIKRNLKSQRAEYVFNMTSSEGAILVLPDGAVRSELEDNKQLDEIREYAARWAYRWCRFSGRDSLYLVTAVYKSQSWTLGSFSNGSPGTEILIHRQPCRNGNTPMYKWEYEIPVDDQQGPENNFHLNQTVFIKGFRVTVKKGWIPIVEWLERINWQFARVFTRPCSTILRQLLTCLYHCLECFVHEVLTKIQPQHPLDIINSVILEKNRRAPIAITHDNDWIKMVERGLPRADLLHEDQIREFVVKEHMWELDSNNAVYLRNTLEGSNGGREPTQDTSSLSEGDGPWLSIKNMRLENVTINHMYAGVCILIQFGSTTWRTQNKLHASVVEWDEEVTLPSDVSVGVVVCGVFQIGSTLGTREIFTNQMILSKNPLGGIHVIELSVGEAEPYCSLLITLGQRFSLFETLSSLEEKMGFAEKTNLAFEALYSYYDDRKEEQLERAHDLFENALQCHFDSTLHATAFFNLATLKLIRCQARGTYSELNVPIKLYEDALELRGPGHPDRPATLLLLAQTLLSHLGQGYEESVAERIMDLLAEISHDSDRVGQTAAAILCMRRLYQAVHSGNASEVNNLLGHGDIGCNEYVPPYGYFDRPHILHKLGVALLERFQYSKNLADLNQSIELNKEALSLIPDGHDDKKNIVKCLARSYIKRIEALDDLTDVDVSADLLELGERVVEALGNMAVIEGAGLTNELYKQIALMSAAVTVLHCIEEEAPPPRTPMVQSLVDEWSKEDGTQDKCKRQLGVLLSFLGGEGKSKICELLEQLGEEDYHFAEYKTKEVTQVLQVHMSYFRRSLRTCCGTCPTLRVLLQRATLHRTGRYAATVQVFDAMFSSLGDPDVGDRQLQYVDPEPVIQHIVEDVIRPIPHRILIDTFTGHLHDKKRQAEAFRIPPIYDELISLIMTTPDEVHIQEAVKKFYRYATFSRDLKRGEGEPLLRQTEDISIYALEPSPENMKLQKSCLLARDRGFRWAWGDA